MSNEDKFDVIIVGAGPAGSACAYTLAKAGKNVLVIERGDTPGCKNVTGGRLYTYALEMLEQGLFEEAALDRRVTHEEIMIISGDRAVTIDFNQPGFNPDSGAPMSFTVLRAVFDEWLAAKAEEMGAIVACGIKVDQLIEQNGKIVGVIAGEDEMYADIVIAADGVNSFMAQQAGLIQDIVAKTVGVGVKEVIELPAKKPLKSASTLKQAKDRPDDTGLHGRHTVAAFCIPIRTAYRWAVSSCPGKQRSTRNQYTKYSRI